MRTNEEYRLKRLHEVCFIDITNERFGRLVVTGINKTVGKVTYWDCVCDCGNTAVVVGSSLRSGHTKSCGCAHKGALLKDLTGQKFGKLTVISYCKCEGKNHFWNCICDCGNNVIANGKTMRAGNKTSCGCARRCMKPLSKRNDLTNMKFGNLIALEPRNRSKWLCKCTCGNIKVCNTSDLKRGFIISCGCVHINTSGSVNELEIKNFVKSLLSDDMEIVKGRVLYSGKTKKEIDIYIPSLNLGIEYNGSAFHTSENSKFNRNKDKYYHRDKFLQAKSQNIRLLTIFDIDYENNKESIFEQLKSIITKSEIHDYPIGDIYITNNDIDDGNWLKAYGYKELCQLEPDYYIYKSMYKVYRCGKTVWKKVDNTEVTN